MPIHVTQENFETSIKQATKPVILDIFAEWCGPCQQMEPIFEELEKELGSQFVFAKINVDEARELAIQYGVSSVPTFIFIKNQKVVGKETGYMPKEAMVAKIKEYLG